MSPFSWVDVDECPKAVGDVIARQILHHLRPTLEATVRIPGQQRLVKLCQELAANSDEQNNRKRYESCSLCKAGAMSQKHGRITQIRYDWSTPASTVGSISRRGRVLLV